MRASATVVTGLALIARLASALPAPAGLLQTRQSDGCQTNDDCDENYHCEEAFRTDGTSETYSKCALDGLGARCYSDEECQGDLKCNGLLGGGSPKLPVGMDAIVPG